MPNKSVEYYVHKYADKYKLDPKAVLAVASREGGIKWGGVGDGNTSFGPWQLHIGGALPSQYKTPEEGKQFANSEAGVEYAMRKMAESGAAGLSGKAAIVNIVRKFERPRADLIEGEIAGAIDWYHDAPSGGPRLDDGDDPTPGEDPETGGGEDAMRHSLIARVMENNAIVAAGGQAEMITAMDFLAMQRNAKESGTSGMTNDNNQPDTGKYKSKNGIVNPLSTKMGDNSEFKMPNEFGAHSSEGRFHAGKDWFGKAGTPIVSPEAGKVIEVKANTSSSGSVFGGTVKVQTSGGRVYVFRHVSPGNVKVGQKVGQGQHIAGVAEWQGGSEHTHIEIWKTREGGYNLNNMIDPTTVFS